MEVLDVIKARRSVRSYEDKDIPDDVLDRILEAGRIAPSASNLQPWHFIVVRDASKRKALSIGRFAKFLTESPLVIVGCADRDRSSNWCVIDTTIALQNMVLQATAEGLGTCWIGSFDEDDVKSHLKVPKNFGIVALLAVGYPREKIDFGSILLRTRNRKDIKRIVSFDEFGNNPN